MIRSFDRFRFSGFFGMQRHLTNRQTNVGGQYTVTADSGASASVLVGQSFALFGQNSFDKTDDPTRIGPDSGLDTKRSDYVAGFTYVPNSFFSVASHLLLDEKSFDMRMAEVEGRAQFDRFQANVIYGRYDKAALQGYDDIREGVSRLQRLFG